MMITDVLQGIFGVLTGGATGLLGVVAQRYFDLKNKQQEIEVVKLNLENALRLKSLEIEQSKQEWAAKEAVARIGAQATTEVAEQERFGKEAGADAEVQMSSYGADTLAYLNDAVLSSQSSWLRGALGIVDVIRGLTRPTLTAYLTCIAHSMYLLAPTPEVVATLLYLDTVAVVWWFGTRPPKRSVD
jgi:hypothetical protein